MAIRGFCRRDDDWCKVQMRFSAGPLRMGKAPLRRRHRKLSATEKAAFECYIKFSRTNGQVVDTGKKAPIVDDADYANRRAATRKQRKRGQDLLQECLNLINGGKCTCPHTLTTFVQCHPLSFAAS
jgi:hypothetical protein